jgi:hypothetical protein
VPPSTPEISEPDVEEPAPTPQPVTDPPVSHIKSETEIESEIAEELRIARSQAVSEMNERKTIQEDANVANANDELRLSGDSADEIFIDVRGNIRQENDSE